MNDIAEASEASCACLIRKSLISKGLSASYVLSFTTSIVSSPIAVGAAQLVKSTTAIPDIVSSVFPTAYGMPYPSAGTLLFASS